MSSIQKKRKSSREDAKVQGLTKGALNGKGNYPRMTVTAREAYSIWKRDFRRGRLLGDYSDFNATFRDMAYRSGLIPLPPGWKLPLWSMLGGPLGGGGGMGYVLGRGAGAAAADWWLSGGVSAANCVAAYTPKGAASLAASYDNNAAPGNGLADGTYDAAPGVAPSFDTATGWTFNGSSQYLTTGVAPAAGYSMIARVSSGSTSGTRTVMGTVRISAPIARFYMRTVDAGTGRSYGYGNTGTALDGTQRPALTSGVIAIVGDTGYINGSSDIDSNGTWITTALTITIGGEQRDASITNYFSGNVLAAAIYDVTLSAAQVAAISSAAAAL